MKICILIDNGHGEDTPGKNSPDYRLREYKYTREIAREVCRRLCAKGVDAMLLTPEENDVRITERVRRANGWCKKYGAENVLLVSIHVNAAGGDGNWRNARGWLSIIDDNAGEGAKEAADLLADEAVRRDIKLRQYKLGQKWYLYGQALGKKGARLGLLKGTACAAVLTENLFQDNKDDVDYLLSDEGRQAIIGLHVDAICKWVAGR